MILVRQPFRSFFALAALDGIAALLPWLPALAGCDCLGAADAVSWHRGEFLFGFVPAVLCGFLLTALPRWTGQPPLGAAGVLVLLFAWLVGRGAIALPVFAPLTAILVVLGLAAPLAIRIIQSSDRRNDKIVALLVVYAAGAGLAGNVGGIGSIEAGYRLAVAAIIGLIAVIGGRTLPALTASYLGCETDPATPARGLFERLAAATTLAALALWVGLPESSALPLVAAAAGAAHFGRLSQWQVWQCRGEPVLLTMSLAYGALAGGFFLLAVAPLAPPTAIAALHCWTVGAIWLMCLSVMASMIRKRCGIAFQPSRVLTTTMMVAVAATVMRLAAIALDNSRSEILLAAVGGWLVAQALFFVYAVTTIFRHRPSNAAVRK